ncbi:MAG: hypothetical protein R3E12_09340 [Candidatus Eisenbacteria bacterium]|uniref:P/Homo B domain-containing protein n=1 Tax=Eiseniibacteriota bacterium TaxID=2212470 RepID=A0A956M235_UNCEI|nr:hypothetical protein [Candidatus Eisenbacteria bacterium]
MSRTLVLLMVGSLYASPVLGWTSSTPVVNSNSAEGTCRCPEGISVEKQWCDTFGARNGALIPDGTHDGLALGPQSSSAGDLTDTVTLSIDLSHPHVSDLSLTLAYDANGDGVVDASSPVELYLARRSPDGPEAWFCTDRMDGTYYFRDLDWKESGADADFAVFADLPSGGAWYLTVVDSTEGDVGVVRSWNVTEGTRSQHAQVSAR